MLSSALSNLVVSVLCFQCSHSQLFCTTNTHTNSICSLKASATARSSRSEKKQKKTPRQKTVQCSYLVNSTILATSVIQQEYLTWKSPLVVLPCGTLIPDIKKYLLIITLQINILEGFYREKQQSRNCLSLNYT